MFDLDAYREHLVGEGLGPRTIRTYTSHVRRAMAWCEEQDLDLAALRPTEIAELADSMPHSHSTLGQLRAALGHWWTHVGRPDAPVKAIRIPPAPRPVSRALSLDDAALLVKAATGWHPQGTAVLMGLYLGLRREEIAKSRWDWFKGTMDWATIEGKGDYTATLPVHPDLRRELRRAPRESRYIFPGHQGRRYIHPATIWAWTKQVAEAAGLDPVTTHQLRHTCLTTMNDRTGNLRAVSSFARHRKLDTTLIYTRTADQALLDVMESLDYRTGGRPPLRWGDFDPPTRL